MKQRVCLWSCI